MQLKSCIRTFHRIHSYTSSKPERTVKEQNSNLWFLYWSSVLTALSTLPQISMWTKQCLFADQSKSSTITLTKNSCCYTLRNHWDVKSQYKFHDTEPCHLNKIFPKKLTFFSLQNCSWKFMSIHPIPSRILDGSQVALQGMGFSPGEHKSKNRTWTRFLGLYRRATMSARACSLSVFPVMHWL